MIGFVEAVRNGFEQYLSVRGRASRAEYWWWVLFNAIVQLLLGDSRLGPLALFVLLVPGVTVLVRRLHDMDRSAWFLLVALIPVVGLIVLLIIVALPGTPASNTYGPPRAPSGGPARPASPEDPWQPGDA